MLKMGEETVQEINEAVEDGEIELDKWEKDFIDSMNEWVACGRKFTLKQKETIDKIYEKYLVPF